MTQTTTQSKFLYVESSSLEFAEAKRTGTLRCIVGDAYDTDAREGQYKGTRKQQFFSFWDIGNHRDHAVHRELRRPVYRSRVKYAKSDVQTLEAFDFKVNKDWSKSRMQQYVQEIIGEAVETVNGRIRRTDFIPTTWQRRAIQFVASCWEEGKKTVLLELAARFGKTGTLVQLFDYSDADLMVVTNYVKTVNTSFGDTVVKFFNDKITYVDSKDSDFENKVKRSLAAGRKVLVTCSLFGKRGRDSINFLSTIDNRFVVVDEADFGAHTPGNMEKVNDLRSGVPLILMTGTNADRAASTHKIDSHLAVTYFDMLMQVNS